MERSDVERSDVSFFPNFPVFPTFVPPVEQSEPTLFPVPPFPLTTSSEANRGTMRVACFLERGEQVKRKARIQLSFPAVVGGNSSMVE